MRIGLIDIDYKCSFPNIPLMKISAWHKSQGNTVEWYLPFRDRYDLACVFFTFALRNVIPYEFSIMAEFEKRQMQIK